MTPVTLQLPLQGTPSLRPRTPLRPLALPAWQPKWDDDDNAVNDGTLDDDSDVGSTEETKDEDSLVVDAIVMADRDVNAHTAAEDTTNAPILTSFPRACPDRCPLRSAPP